MPNIQGGSGMSRERNGRLCARLRVDDATGGLAGIADEIDGWHFRRHLLNRHPGEFNATTFKCEK
jgi:hypothetical protein